MGRPSRFEYRGATYHIYSRGNRRSAVYQGPDEYLAYLYDLEQLAREHEARVLGFCLMPNHPHLCVRTDGDPISVFMQRLTLRHAKRFNRTRNCHGHLNECRYRAEVVDDRDYLLRLVRYIHRNPVAACLVGRLEDWPYNSHLAYLGRSFLWVETRQVLDRLGGLAPYLRWVGERPTEGEEESMELPRPGRNRSLPEGLRLVDGHGLLHGPWTGDRPAVPIREFAEQLALRLKVCLGSISSPSRIPPLPELRSALALGLRERGYRLDDIGQLLKRGEPAISKMLARARLRRSPIAELLASTGPALAVNEDVLGWPSRTGAA